MSYSFSVKAADKMSALVAVAAEFDRVVETQPIHAKDRDAAIATAIALVDLLVESDKMDISVSLSGYVSWRQNEMASPLTAASVSASAALVTRQPHP